MSNISTEPEEFDDEARALADAIQATPEDPFVDETPASIIPTKKKSSVFMKIVLGFGTVCILGMGGAYYYTTMQPPPIVKKPSMPKLSDEIVSKPQDSVPTPVAANNVPTPVAANNVPTPVAANNVPAPVAVKVADPFAAAAPVEVAVPVVADIKAAKAEPITTEPVVKSESKVKKIKPSVSSRAVKKDDTGYVQLF